MARASHHHPAPLAATAAWCVALATAGAPAAAQTVEGQLVDESTHAPVTGAFIVLLDSSGARVARTLTDEAGRFVVRAPTAGTYVVKVERIGYRSWSGPPQQLGPGEVVRQDIGVSVIPVQLDAVVIRADHDCRVRPTEGQAAAVLWEEARKALSAAEWAQEEGWFQYVVTRYERDLDPTLRVVQEELTSADTLFTRSPFVSPPAEQLAQGGYVRVRPDGAAHYFAPDAEALLSDTFLDGHCFRVKRSDRRHRGMIGLEFEPARGRDLPDVTGILWLDSATAELRTLEFTYTNFHLAGFVVENAAGLIEFRRVPSGHWVVREWWIQMPILAVSEDRRRGERRPVVTGYRIAGGRVRAVITEQGTRRFDMAAGTVTGTVAMGDAGTRLPGVEVSLTGTAYSATTDAFGRFRIAEVPEGRYTAQVSHAAFNLLGATRMHVEVRAEEETTVRLSSPSAEEITATWCDANRTLGGNAVLIGFVRDASGAPVTGATVEAARQEVLDAVPTDRSDVSERRGGINVVSTSRSLTAAVDARGAYVLCGLPHGVPLTVRASLGPHEGEPVRVVFDVSELRSLDLRVGR